MQRALMLTAAVAAAISLAACSKRADETVADTSAAADQSVGATQDAIGAAVGQTSAATLGSYDTGAFVSNTSQSDMYEVRAAQIAETRSKNADVKAFAKMMTTAHTAMMNEMKPLVMAANEKPADKLDERRQGFIDNLTGATDANFDKTYIDQQVAAHGEALTLMQGYAAAAGGDAGLKAGAAKAAPKVQMHLDKAKAIQAAMK